MYSNKIEMLNEKIENVWLMFLFYYLNIVVEVLVILNMMKYHQLMMMETMNRISVVVVAVDDHLNDLMIDN